MLKNEAIADEYTKNALASESNIADLDHEFPFPEAVDVACSGREADLLKRRCFYAKKPDKTKDKQYDSDMEDLCLRVAMMYEAHKKIEDFGKLISPRMFHALIGLMTEVGEIWEEVINAIYEKRPINEVNLQEEFGDLE